MSAVPGPYPWRQPGAETSDYPGLWVHDGRQTGSITVGQSRLPLWAFAGVVARFGWDEVESGYEPERYEWSAEKHDAFIYWLLEQRGEFARLLCILADVERIEAEREDEGIPNFDDAWWRDDVLRGRVTDQLRRCLEALEGEPDGG